MLAKVLVLRDAGFARAAWCGLHPHHGIAGYEIGDARANGFDIARSFVTEGTEGKFRVAPPVSF
jgi:hypothetical protein